MRSAGDLFRAVGTEHLGRCGKGSVADGEIPVIQRGNPWLDSFGRSADDPDFDEYLREVSRARAADAPA